MMREEWRMHSHLFGGRRFALFPIVLTLIVAGAVTALVETGTPLETLVIGVHVLALIFGMHTGSIGLVGRDAMRNLLGDVTLVVFTARTLPLSQRRLLGLFVLKDLGYYTVLFLLPMAIGVSPALVLGEGMAIGAVIGDTLALWVTLSAMFFLGVVITLAGIGVASRGVPGVLIFGGLIAGVAFAWLQGVAVWAVTPYGVFVEPTLARLAGAVASIGALLAIGILTFDVRPSNGVRTARARYDTWNDRIGDPVATKTLLDVHRSSGGLGKAVFSAAILFVVTYGLLEVAGRITGVEPSVGISFGAILGLTGFTTYNWLTQFDGMDGYRRLPLSVGDVLDGKFLAFLMLGPAVGVATYLLAVAWLGTTLLEAVLGGILLVGVACYVFGLTVYLAGLSPNEFLFDTGLFVAFGVAIALPLVPVLVVGLVLTPLSSTLAIALGVGGVALGVAGVVAFKLARGRWTDYHRR